MAVVPDLGYCDTLGRPLNFDAGSVEGLVGLTGTTPPVASTDFSLSGSYSLKCSVNSGDNGRSHGDYANTAGSGTNYYSDGGASGNSVWFAWDWYISDFATYNSYKYFTYWSHDGTLGTSAILMRPVQNTSNWEFVYNGGSNATGSLGAMVLDTWEHWTVNINFSSDNTVGQVDVWRDGTQIVTGLKPSAGTYDDGQGTAMSWRVGFNRNSADTTLNTVYWDNIAVATTRAGVEEVGPTPSAVAAAAGLPHDFATRNALVLMGGASKQGDWT